MTNERRSLLEDLAWANFSQSDAYPVGYDLPNNAFLVVCEGGDENGMAYVRDENGRLWVGPPSPDVLRAFSVIHGLTDTAPARTCS